MDVVKISSRKLKSPPEKMDTAFNLMRMEASGRGGSNGKTKES